MKTKQSKFVFSWLLAGVVFMGSCTYPDTKKNYTHNYFTKADTEAFNFLKKVYEQALFQQYAAQTYSLGAQSQSITDTYKALAEEIEQLAIENHVLLTTYPANHFVEGTDRSNTSASFAKNDTAAVDSTMQSPLVQHRNEDEQPQAAVQHANAKSGLHVTPANKVIHSQEEILHEFEVASRNTNMSIRRFAQNNLERVHDLLEQSRSSIN